MQDNRSWKEKAQDRASRLMRRLMGKSPRSSDQDSSSPESTPPEVRQAVVGRHSGSNHSVPRAELHPPPSRKTSVDNKSADSHKLAAKTSKTGEATAGRSSAHSSNSSDKDSSSPEPAPPKVCHAVVFRQSPGGKHTSSSSKQHPPPTQKTSIDNRSPDSSKPAATTRFSIHPSNSSRPQGQQPRGMSVLKPPGSSRAAGPPEAAHPDMGNTVATNDGVTDSTNTNMTSDTEAQQVADFPQAIEMTHTIDGVNEFQQATPQLTADTTGVSQRQGEAEQREESRTVTDQSGLSDDVKGEGSTVPETSSIGKKIIKFPLLLFSKSLGVTPGAEPTDGAETTPAEVVSSPKETGVGDMIKQILPTLPKFNLSSPAETDSKVNSKIKDFFKYTLGRQEVDKTPAIDTVKKWSLTEVQRADHQGAEQVKGRDYGKWRPSSNDQQRLNQALPESDTQPREVTKRRGTIYAQDLQQQMPDLGRFRPRDSYRKRVTYAEDTQQRPDQSMPEPDEALLRLKDVPRRRGSISYDEYQRLNQQMPVTTINTSAHQDLEIFLQLLGVDKNEDLATTVSDEPLTDTQTDAFREVFEQFAQNSHGYIDKESLTSALDRLQISINPEQMEKALETADYDEDGEVSFQDFLSVITDSQRFSKCVKAVGAESPQSVEVFETVFYKSLTKMLEAGILPTATTGEIVQYYHKKILRLIRRAVRPGGAGGGHLLTYYSKGAYLIGFKSKQLMKYIKPLEPKEKEKDSPYSKCPSLRKVRRDAPRLPLKPAMMVKMGRMKSVKTWKTVEIEDRIRQLSIKHPGMETMEMITPVKIKVNMSLKERDRLTYNQIGQIQRKSKSGQRRYLKTLTQLKRRDTWNSWGSLQCYCDLHSNKDFPETFTAYSWSWSGCRNAMETGDLDVGPPDVGPPPPARGHPPGPVHRKRRSQSDRGGLEGVAQTAPAGGRSCAPDTRDQVDGSSTSTGTRSGPSEQTGEDPAPDLPRWTDSPLAASERSNTNINTQHTGSNSAPSSLGGCNPSRPDEYTEFDSDYDYEWNIAPYYVIRKDRPPS